jgi:hypothetical protein
MDKFIVAEVSQNWPAAGHTDTVSGKFEQVINYNLKRGYKLHSWKFNQIVDSDGNLNETIIAVFELTYGATGVP